MTVTQSCDACVRITEAAKTTAEEAGAEVKLFVTEYDPALQAQQINQAISQQVDLAIIWPADAAAILPSLVRLKKANIPVVILNGMPETDYTSLYASFAGPNDLQFGKDAADAMIQGFKDKGHGDTASIILIQGSPGVPSGVLREKGFRDQLAAKAPGLKVVDAQPGNWDQTQATDAAAALLTKNPDVQGVYAVADNMLAGAITAAERAGLKPEQLVTVGANCSIEGFSNIKSGKQFASVLQDPNEEGGNAGKAAVAILSGEDVKQVVYDTSPLITESNLSECAEAVK